MERFKLKSNLSEKQIEADVAAYLGWSAVGLPIRLIDVDEQVTGADKRYDSVIPFYIQFKKSLGLKPLRSAVRPLRGKSSKLQEIRRFRSENELQDDPTLYFQLRKKAEHAHDLQHNILLKHQKPDVSFALYVAPLYLDKDRYAEDIFAAPRYLEDPWAWRQTVLHYPLGREMLMRRYFRQPFLRNHVSITPHVQVADHEHFYAYGETGYDVSWHSPEKLEGGFSRLSDFMDLRLNQLFQGKGSSPKACIDFASRIASSIDEGKGFSFFDGEPIEQLHRYGQWLLKSHGIRQFLLCANSGEMESLSERLDFV